VGGPNFTSSFHVIGAIFDKVYNLGGLMSPPQEGIQTVSLAPGGAVITEFKLLCRAITRSWITRWLAWNGDLPAF
jgi:hypothetical protein